MAELPPPTRGNLMQAKRMLTFAREGHDLLDHKRQVLLREIVPLGSAARATEERLADGFDRAYRTLAFARLTLGTHRVELAALAATGTTQLRIVERSIMGVPIPTIELQRSARWRIPYGPGGTDAALDRAMRQFAELLRVICEAAEMETAVLRLAREVRKTQRRVNALGKIYIPRYEQQVAYITGVLDQLEREAFFRAKKVKETQERGRGVGTSPT